MEKTEFFKHLRPGQKAKRRMWTCLALLGVALTGSLPVMGDSPGISLEQYVHAFESSYHGVNTLRAEFTQTSTSRGRTRIESGMVSLAKGGRMRWDYRVPEVKLFVSDGKEFSLYVPAEKQVTRSEAKTTDDFRTPLSVLLSRFSLRRVFSKVDFADQALQAEPGNRVLRGYPKKGFEDEYREVLIEITSKMDIRRLVVFYPDDSTMEFTFTNIQRNVVLPPSIFRFVPPADAEVIRE